MSIWLPWGSVTLSVAPGGRKCPGGEQAAHEANGRGQTFLGADCVLASVLGSGDMAGCGWHGAAVGTGLLVWAALPHGDLTLLCLRLHLYLHRLALHSLSHHESQTFPWYPSSPCLSLPATPQPSPLRSLLCRTLAGVGVWRGGLTGREDRQTRLEKCQKGLVQGSLEEMLGQIREGEDRQG